ncbi:MAG: CbtA family protein [Solirubrobacteraceae bacterium]
MLRKLLICGLVAGLCGGLLATGFVSLAGEPAVDRAIAYEDARDRAPAAMPGVRHETAAPAPVSRSLQKSAGLLTAGLVYGLALGGAFALAFALAYGRVVRAGPRATAYGLAAAAFTVVYLVPFLKYPASPPAATDPSTIGRRTALYATMIAISVLAAVAASRLRPALERRFDAHAANLGAGLAFLVVVVAAGLALPAVNEIPKDFPATTLWRFREASVGMQAVLWLTIGLVFAPIAQRAMSGQPIIPRRAARRRVPAGAGD